MESRAVESGSHIIGTHRQAIIDKVSAPTFSLSSLYSYPTESRKAILAIPEIQTLFRQRITSLDQLNDFS